MTDYRSGGSSALSLDREYASNNADLRSGQIAAGWSLKFDYEITKFFDTELWFSTPGGKASVYLLDPATGTYKPANNPASSRAVRTTTPSEFIEVWLEDDRYIKFERPSDYTTDPIFYPTVIRERSGYQQTITRNPSGLIQTVVDTFGRTLTFTWSGNDLQQVAAPGGVTVSYTYDYGSIPNTTPANSVKRLKTVTVAGSGASEVTTYHYEDPNFPGALTGITDPRGVRIKTIVYDGNGRVIESGLIGGNDKTTFSYALNQTTLTNALGKQSTQNYQEIAGKTRLVGVDGVASTNCPASARAITYYADGSLDTQTDEEGRVTKYVNDTRGQPTSITRGYGTPEAVSTSYTYHPTYRAPTQMVEPGKTTNYTWDTSGRLTTLQLLDTTTTTVPYSTNGQSRTTTYTYTTAAGLLATVDGPLAGVGDKVTYTYDVNGYVKTITNELGHVTTVNTVNGRGQPTQITDPNAVVTNLTYDFQGRLLTTTVNPGATQAVTTMTYDGAGQITKITRPDGSYLGYTYNDARRLTTVTNTTGETINYTYDLMGGVTSRIIKGSGGAITLSQTQTYDELGRLLKNIGAYNQTTTYGYEKNDNLKSVTDPRSGLYSYGYDSLNRLITTTDQENSVVTLTRNGQDNTTAYKDPRNLTTTYVRNGFGEIIQEVSPDRGTTTTVRDARGLPTQITDGRAIVTNMTYDNAGRIKTKTYPAATAENVTYTYDNVTAPNKGKGRLTKVASQSNVIDFVYDVRGNVTKETRTIATKVHVVSYVYDLADRITQITYPSGRIVTYTRDTTGRITGVTTKLNATAASVTLASGIVYQPTTNLVQSMTYGNGLNDWNTYTLDHELDVLGVYDGAASVINRSHTRTDALNLTNVWDNVTAANNQSYWANAANRLQNASGAWGAKTFYYDGVGNRTQEVSTPNGGATTTDTLGYAATNNRVASVTRPGLAARNFTYDNAGNILTDNGPLGNKTYTYNKRNRLSVATVGALTYTYTTNALEQLAIRVQSSPAATTHFIHDRMGNVIAETAGGGATGATGTTREYIYLYEAEIAPTMGSRTVVDRPLAVVSAVNTAPVTYWVSVDHLNRPVKMTTSTKSSVWDAIWQPWGGVHSITGTASYNARFPGQWFQVESGLHYNWHRSYDPTLGRYTQPDPLGFVDGPSVYGYAGGSPQRSVDKAGLQSSLPQSRPVTGQSCQERKCPKRTYYRMPHDYSEFDLVMSTQMVCATAGGSRGGRMQCVRAYAGQLPPKTTGYEFTTDICPSNDGGLVHGPNSGATVEWCPPIAGMIGSLHDPLVCIPVKIERTERSEWR
ncbi:MAG: RHS repeat-associated core domain-containing protein [Hyphomicrobiaceae bacterium]